jgi:hypothetical protein
VAQEAIVSSALSSVSAKRRTGDVTHDPHSIFYGLDAKTARRARALVAGAQSMIDTFMVNGVVYQGAEKRVRSAHRQELAGRTVHARTVAVADLGDGRRLAGLFVFEGKPDQPFLVLREERAGRADRRFYLHLA